MFENKDTIDKIGFDIGWDFYAKQMHLPEKALNNQAIAQGYNEAQSRKISTSKADRFERKHLTLRANAMIRGKAFDPNITTDFIRHIDQPICHILHIPLTHGTMTDSDWSVDRIHNDAGYVTGNIVVVSTKANKAKGSMSFQEISALVDDMWNNPSIKSELTVYQWMRWLTILSRCIPADLVMDGNFHHEDDGKTIPENERHLFYKHFVYAPTPCLVPSIKGVMTSPFHSVQMMISNYVLEDKLANQDIKISMRKFIGYLPQSLGSHFEKILKSAKKIYEKQESHNPLDIWFNVSLYTKIQDVYNNPDTCSAMNEALRNVRRDKEKENSKSTAPSFILEHDNWHTDTLGYIKRN